MIFFRLCKAGYAKSVPDAMELDVRTVLQALHYEAFLTDFETAYLDLNK